MDKYTVTHDRDWTWIQFPAGKPAESTLARIRPHARYSRRRVAWYVRERVEESTVAQWLGVETSAPPRDIDSDYLACKLAEIDAPEVINTQPEPETVPAPPAPVFESKVYEIGKNGTLVEKVEKFTDLQPGTVITWGGNMGFPRTSYVILSRNEPTRFSGVSYQCYNIDNEDQNATLNRVEARSIKSYDDPDLWHSQHYFLEVETRTPAEVEQARENHIRQSTDQAQREAEIKAENDRLETIGRQLWDSLIGDVPAVIIAEREKSDCDMMTDYFGSHTTDSVILAGSKHTRDLFPEMRKAAELIPETQHLGRGKGRYLPYVAISQDFYSNGANHYAGARSHWHGELDQDENTANPVEFTTREEAEAHIKAKGDPEPIHFDGQKVEFEWKIREEEIENREKYTGGGGYYLGHDRYSGWKVSKTGIYKGKPSRGLLITLARRHDHLKPRKK